MTTYRTIPVTLTEEQVKRLDELQNHTESKDHEVVIKKALTALDRLLLPGNVDSVFYDFPENKT